MNIFHTTRLTAAMTAQYSQPKRTHRVLIRRSRAKSIQDFVFTDGTAEQSVERRFAQDLDATKEVCVYAKLPKGFHIPTPVGNYSPDWAIAQQREW